MAKSVLVSFFFKGNKLFIASSQFCPHNGETPAHRKAVVWRCSVERVFVEISQNSQENTCASLFFKKVAGWAGLGCIIYPVNFENMFGVAAA